MVRVVMHMGFQFNWLVLMNMPLFVPFMSVRMIMLVRMWVLMLMGVGMCVLILPVLMGMLMFMLMPVLMFMGVIMFAFHQDSPPFTIKMYASM